MKFARPFVLFAATFGLMAAPGIAGAASCDLKQIASIPATLSSRNQLLLDAVINDLPVKIQLDTGASVSTLSERFVARAGMPIENSHTSFYGLTGRSIDQQTRVSTMRLGESTSTNALFIVAPTGGDGTTDEPVGWFGSDYLQNYDVEINAAGGKVNLFSRDHCPGKLVYWAPEFFKSDIYYVGTSPVHRPMLDIVVDGQKLRGLLDTGAFMTVMRLAVAQQRFGLSPSSSGMEKIGESVGMEGVKIDTYRYGFQSMTFGEITLHNPKIVVSPINSGAHVNRIGTHIKASAADEEDLLIGMSLVKQLRLAIAYNEKAIYYTIAPQTQAATQ